MRHRAPGPPGLILQRHVQEGRVEAFLALLDKRHSQTRGMQTF